MDFDADNPSEQKAPDEAPQVVQATVIDIPGTISTINLAPEFQVGTSDEPENQADVQRCETRVHNVRQNVRQNVRRIRNLDQDVQVGTSDEPENHLDKQVRDDQIQTVQKMVMNTMDCQRPSLNTYNSENSAVRSPGRSPFRSPRPQVAEYISVPKKALFASAEELKQQVRSHKLIPNPYNVVNCYHETGCFQWLAKHPYFENFTLSVIVVNAFWISVDTDGNTADTILDAGAIYVAADCLFLGFFSFELFVRFMAFKQKRKCLKDGWFVFDTTLVTLYWFDPFTIGLLAFIQGGAGLNLPTAVLRLFRLARLSRLIRMLRSLPELMIMIKGMMSAAASVGYTLGLLLLITYVFSIALRNLVPPDSEIAEDYFSTVPEAMHNLIVYGTFLDALSDFIIPVKEQSTVCFCFTWMYIALAAMTVMNMLIGVLCEVIAAVAETEQESMMVDKVNEKFSDIVATLDEDHDGSLSWKEFQQIIELPEALSALESMNVDAESMVDMAEDFFFDDQEPVDVSFQDFMGLVLDLRGGQPATVHNIMAMNKGLNKKFFSVKNKLVGIEGRCEKIDTVLDQMLKRQDIQPRAISRQSTSQINGSQPRKGSKSPLLT